MGGGGVREGGSRGAAVGLLRVLHQKINLSDMAAIVVDLVRNQCKRAAPLKQAKGKRRKRDVVIKSRQSPDS